MAKANESRAAQRRATNTLGRDRTRNDRLTAILKAVAHHSVYTNANWMASGAMETELYNLSDTPKGDNLRRK